MFSFGVIPYDTPGTSKTIIPWRPPFLFFLHFFCLSFLLVFFFLYYLIMIIWGLRDWWRLSFKTGVSFCGFVLNSMTKLTNLLFFQTVFLFSFSSYFLVRQIFHVTRLDTCPHFSMLLFCFFMLLRYLKNPFGLWEWHVNGMKIMIVDGSWLMRNFVNVDEVVNKYFNSIMISFVSDTVVLRV